MSPLPYIYTPKYFTVLELSSKRNGPEGLVRGLEIIDLVM